MIVLDNYLENYYLDNINVRNFVIYQVFFYASFYDKDKKLWLNNSNAIYYFILYFISIFKLATYFYLFISILEGIMYMNHKIYDVWKALQMLLSYERHNDLSLLNLLWLIIFQSTISPMLLIIYPYITIFLTLNQYLLSSTQQIRC